MALNALTLSVSNGIQGKSFKSAVSGMTPGNLVEVMPRGAPGFGYSNGFLTNPSLSYDANLVILRERNEVTGENRTTQLIITAISPYALQTQAGTIDATYRTYRTGAVKQGDGSEIWYLFVEGQTGATLSAAAGTVIPVSISGTPPAGIVSSAYSFTPTTANGSGAKSFALTGTLPTGLNFSTTTGAITGTPTTVQTVSGLNITVTDSSGSAALGAFSIAITAALSISGTPSSATIGSAYSFTPTAAGGSGTRTFSYSGTSLAGFGLSFDTTTGAITGTVSGSPGTITGTITVTDSSGSANLPITVSVSAAAAIPVNSVAPAVTGSGTTASPLSATNGTWSNSPTGYTYQWLRNGSAISGATASTYVYVLADSGTNITAQVIASNAVGAGSPATSNTIAAGTISAATFTRATDQPAGLLADHTYQCDTETGSVFNLGKATVNYPVTVTANGWIWVRLRDKTTGLQVGPISAYQVTTATTSIPFNVPGRLGWGYVDMSTDATTWATFAGTLAIGAGDQTLASGQSLMANFIFTTGTTLSAAGLSTADINALAYCRTFATSDAYSQATLVGVVWEQPGTANHIGPGHAMYLSKMAQSRQRNQAMSSHAVAGTTQASWQPLGGNLNVTRLNNIIAVTGGSYRYVMWWQGQADAVGNVLGKHYTRDLNYHMFGALTGSGTTGGLAALNSYVDPTTGLTSRNGGVRYLVSTINNMTIGPYYYGPSNWQTEIRKGAYDWTVATPGATHVAIESLQLDAGFVHPTAIGGVEAARSWARAALSDNVGPSVASAIRDPSNHNDIIVTFNISGNLVLTGSWWLRFVAYIKGSTNSRWTITGGDQSGVSAANQVRLHLQSSPNPPTDGDAFDLWLGPAWDGDNASDGSLHMIRDDRVADGLHSVGRGFMPSLVATPVAAINTGVAKTLSANVPVPITPYSMHDITFVANANQTTLVLPTYAGAELTELVGFGKPLIGGVGAGKLITVQSQHVLIASSTLAQTLVMYAKMPASIPANNVTMFSYGNYGFTFNKTTGTIQASALTSSITTAAAVALGHVYWLALTVVGDQVWFYYKDLTAGTATVLRIGATHMTALFSTPSGGINVATPNGGSSFFDGTSAMLGAAVYSEAIYTDSVGSNINPPGAPLTGSETYLQHYWKLTQDVDVSNVSPDAILIA
jgi:hypothetical protein